MPSPQQTTTTLTTLDPLFPEIRLRILSFAALFPTTLLSLVQTCREWHDAYLPALYADVTLHRGNASKFFYGMGAQFGPPLAVMDGRRWVERLWRERDGSGVRKRRFMLGMSPEGHGEGFGKGENVKSTQTEETRVGSMGRGMDGYWSQKTPGERLQTRVSLVQRLELLDGEACLQTSSAIEVIQSTSGDLRSDGRRAALFPACRLLDLREEFASDLCRDSTACDSTAYESYEDFDYRMTNGDVPLRLADMCSVLRLFLPDGHSHTGQYLVWDILEDVAYGANSVEIHHISVLDFEYFEEFSWLYYDSYSFYLRPRTDDPSVNHDMMIECFADIRDKYR
ncbi:hypothetical protein IAT38_002139 [Cryptococcus sp. DSM 104549]